MVTKANPDYTESAVNLTNPPEAKVLLDALAAVDSESAGLQRIIDSYPESKMLAELAEKRASICKEIESVIQQQGSYQDIDAGQYAVRQRVVTVSYDPQKVHDILSPQLAAAVIVESVDKATVNALVKAGRITTEEQKNISEERETYRLFIKTPAVGFTNEF